MEMVTASSGNQEIKDDQHPEGTSKKSLDILNSYLDQIITEFIASISFVTFERIYPEILAADRKGLKACYEQFVIKLNGRIREEVPKILAQDDVASKFNSLDELKASGSAHLDQQAKRPVWRPSGKAELDLRVHRISVKLEMRKQMEEQLKRLQEEETKLNDEVQSRKTRLIQLRKQLNNFENDLNKAMKCINKFSAVEFSSEFGID